MSLFADIAKAAKLKACRVKCDICGKEQDVNGEHCLEHGWPQCHKETMRLITDKERKSE